MDERGGFSVNITTLTGETYSLCLSPFDSLREEISKLGLPQKETGIMILFYEGKQIQPDLTPASLGLNQGDTILVYFKIVKKNIPLYSPRNMFPPKPKIRSKQDEEDRLVDVSMATHENNRDSKAFMKILFENERRKQFEDECRELYQPQTVISSPSAIQTMPLPVCFDIDSAEFSRDYDINPTNLSPLNPFRRSFFPDAPSGR